MSNNQSQMIRALISLTIGIAIGIFAHYMLYRMALPAQPFIYVAF